MATLLTELEDRLGTIIDDLDLGSDQALMQIADKINIGPQFRKVAEAALRD